MFFQGIVNLLGDQNSSIAHDSLQPQSYHGEKSTKSLLPRWSRRKATTLVFSITGILLLLSSASWMVVQQSDLSIAVDASGLNASNSSKCVPATLILFGVPKEFRCIWKHYMRYIVKANPQINFEAHIHLYSDLHLSSFNNAKNNEMNITIESPSLIRSIIDGSSEKKTKDGSNGNDTTTPIFTIPTRLVTSSQNEYDEKNLSWIEERDTNELYKEIFTIPVLKNVFRQGNSMYQAYMSASSHPFFIRNNTTSSSSSSKTYIFLRSDTLLISPIIIPCMGLPINEIHVPSWQTRGFPTYNDRTAIAGGPIAANKYARAKSHAFPEMILDRRNKPGEEKIKWASRQRLRKSGFWHQRFSKGGLYNPERMLKVYLDASPPKVRVKEREWNWAQLIRVRAGGRLQDGGRWKAPRYLNESKSYCQ